MVYETAVARGFDGITTGARLDRLADLLHPIVGPAVALGWPKELILTVPGLRGVIDTNDKVVAITKTVIVVLRANRFLWSYPRHGFRL